MVDARGRVIVADRDNDRLQIFNAQGKLLEVQPVKSPFGVALGADGALFVCSGDKIHQLAESGQIVKSWGKEGAGPLEFQIGHQIAADREGNLFVAEVGGIAVAETAAGSMSALPNYEKSAVDDLAEQFLCAEQFSG